MPELVNATIPVEAERFDLKTLEGAWVLLKPLPYGEVLDRRDRASRMSMDAGGGRRNRDSAKLQIDTMQQQTRIYEFQRCIVDHNLSDGQGNQLNFSNPATINLLHPKVGQEIEELIDQLNQNEEVDEENFPSVPTSSTGGTLHKSKLDTSQDTL